MRYNVTLFEYYQFEFIILFLQWTMDGVCRVDADFMLRIESEDDFFGGKVCIVIPQKARSKFSVIYFARSHFLN